MSHAIRPLAVSLCAIAFAGCATIVSGPNQSIYIVSTPIGARVLIDDQYVGQTPIDVIMSRRRPHVVRIELPGYRPYVERLERRMNGWIFGNIFTGGPIGLAIDAATGAIYKLDPETVYVSFRHRRYDPSQPSVPDDMRTFGQMSPDSGKLTVVFVSKPDPRWKKLGNLSRL
jgi:hypothetical protein